MEEEKPSSTNRRLTGPWKLVATVFPGIGVSLALLFIFGWRPFGFVMVDVGYYYLLLACFMPLSFLWLPATGKALRDRVPIYDIVLAVLALAVPLYFYFNILAVISGGWSTGGGPPIALAMAGILCVLVLEAGRRSGGPVFAGLILIFTLYPLFSTYAPGILWAPTVSWRRLMSFYAMSSDGIMGIPMSTFGVLVIGFMVYAVVVQSVGVGQFFTNIAMAAVGRARAGIPKIAIVGSALFGTISGASVANVFVTGSFTIPAMKKEGMTSETAAAIEALAGTGGVLMPPVMGSVAFIMAQFLGITYGQVCIIATVPAILYYVCMFAHIDAYAVRHGLGATRVKIEAPPIWKTLLSYYHILVSLGVLVYAIFVLRLTSQAPFIASAVAIVLGMVRKETRFTPKALVGLLEQMGRSLGDLICILATIGLIIGSFVITGLAFSFPGLLIKAAGGNVYLLLIMGAAAAFILGMGVPLAAVYIFMAIVLAPALVGVGLNLLASHLFVLYWAMLACITPPVAITVFAASSIARSDPMKSGLVAMRLAAALYILPFIFVLEPSLILLGTPMDALRVIPPTVLGFVVISGGLEGYIWYFGKLTMIGRGLFAIAGVMAALPSTPIVLTGLGLMVLLFAVNYLLRWAKSPALNLLVQ